MVNASLPRDPEAAPQSVPAGARLVTSAMPKEPEGRRNPGDSAISGHARRAVRCRLRPAPRSTRPAQPALSRKNRTNPNAAGILENRNPQRMISAFASEAIHRVVVDHADRLHEGVADGRADELEAARLERFRHGARLGGLRRDLAHRLPVIDERPAVD